jgi:protein-S-isoprenylcysteine O-methyltransferase Ste14
MMFVPAGSLRFWQGWVFIGVVFVPLASAFLYFYKHDPKLIERRLQSKEKVQKQRILMRVWKPFFLAALLLPGLDYRFGWSRTFLGGVPLWLELLSQALLLAALLLVVWVLKVNSFAASTIQVEHGQKVVSTGPYGIVRHPMYLGAVVMMLCTPLTLGSYVALPVFVLTIPFFVFRLLNEEKVLRQELPGYSEYCLHTRFHLIPLVW